MTKLVSFIADCAKVLDGGIRRFATGPDAPDGAVHNLWVERADGQIVAIVTEAVNATPRFEVFPLRIDAAFRPLGHLDWRPWPLGNGRIEILRRMDWTLPAGEWPEAEISALVPGEAPARATDTVLIDVGILLTDSDGARWLVAGAELPLTLHVTGASSTIDAYLADCLRLPA